uniref:Uncharacterized protein n=1 Tax=Myripristis murdjan TaxID=586833 RepID=A0A667XVX5_9TELE
IYTPLPNRWHRPQRPMCSQTAGTLCLDSGHPAAAAQSSICRRARRVMWTGSPASGGTAASVNVHRSLRSFSGRLESRVTPGKPHSTYSRRRVRVERQPLPPASRARQRKEAVPVLPASSSARKKCFFC